MITLVKDPISLDLIKLFDLLKYLIYKSSA